MEKVHYVKSSKILGRGSFATVYKGYAKSTGEVVAIKQFDQKKKTNYMFDREILAFDKLPKHLNVIRVLDTKDTDKNHYIVLEYCNGQSLERYMLVNLCNKFGVSIEQFHQALLDITAGYGHLVAHHLAHRDIKPDNIMIMNNRDGSVTYKLGDLGCAKEYSHDPDDGKQLVSTVGEVEYMDTYVLQRYIEQQNKSVLRKSDKKKVVFEETIDLWSIGCTLVYIACNCLAFCCPPSVSHPLEKLMLMHRNKTDEHIMGTVLPSGDLEHRKDFRESSPIYLETSDTLQALYKELIRYCFLKADKSTDGFFKIVDKIEESRLCYKLDINNGKGIYDVLDFRSTPNNTIKFSLKSVLQLSDKQKSGIPIIFMSSYQKDSSAFTITKPSWQMVGPDSTAITNRDIIISKCGTIRSMVALIDRSYFDLEMLNQLALIVLNDDKYGRLETNYTDIVNAIYKPLTTAYSEVNEIFGDMGLGEHRQKHSDLKTVLQPLSIKCQKLSDEIKKLLVMYRRIVFDGNLLTDMCNSLAIGIGDGTALKNKTLY